MTLNRPPEQLAHFFAGPPELARDRLHQVGEGFTVLETGIGVEAFRRRHPAVSESGVDAQWLEKLACHGWSSHRNRFGAARTGLSNSGWPFNVMI
ncbi:MAG TPA: hypothetical protein VLC55_14285 [Burkholderiales bacterium]|nr:hypothetical protein [Burkholderiales bacterium]